MTATRKPKKEAIRRNELIWIRLGILLLVIGVLAATTYWVRQQLNDPRILPIRSVILDGDFMHVERDRLQQVVTDAVRGGYFTIDVREVQSAVRKLPWVAGASIRRVWPDTLVVSATEHSPFARWGEKELISDKGVVFLPASIEPFEDMPRMSGDKAQAGEVLRQFRHVSKSIEKLTRVNRIEMNRRGGWTVWIDSGPRIELGKDRVPRRLVRVTRFLERLGEQASTVEVIDARYSGGVAVRVRKQTADNRKKPGESRA